MGNESARRLTYDDLQRFPDDGLRRELIDGELFVTPSPVLGHQRVVLAIGAELLTWCRGHGGEAFVAPLDVVFDPTNVCEPDALFFLPEQAERLGHKHVEVVPDLVVEVSSPGTKGVDRIRKRAVYERFGVAEYWIVDLDEDVIEAYVLHDGRYAEPVHFRRGDTVRPAVVPDFEAPYERLVPPA